MIAMYISGFLMIAFLALFVASAVTMYIFKKETLALKLLAWCEPVSLTFLGVAVVSAI